MQATSYDINDKLNQQLNERKASSLYRTLQVNEGLIDFCSNDYLSFARSENIKERVKKYASEHPYLSGSTGSRRISGNTNFAENLEKELAVFHNAEAGLLFNSGYDANVGLFSSIANKGDTFICDELIHASIIDGCRLSHAYRYKFAHNDLEDLEAKLKTAKGTIFIAVESVYSMDGDIAPLKEIIALAKKYNAHVIVDEAHATGIFGKNGRGLVNVAGLEKDVFARVHTFGKAIGCHGAIVLGSEVLRDYLINFSRSFIYTTAMPFHSLITVKSAYDELLTLDNTYLHSLIAHFKKDFALSDAYLIESRSPIQCLVVGGNEKTKEVANQLQLKGFDVRAILSPTVPQGKERLRICLHMHNTEQQLTELKQSLKILS
jgi:8-amino-7-oxononanoate synthase